MDSRKNRRLLLATRLMVIAAGLVVVAGSAVPLWLIC
jgi:hypothetical protein